MKPATSATVLVIALLAGATIGVAAALLMRTAPAYGAEAQDFWREQLARPASVERSVRRFRRHHHRRRIGRRHHRPEWRQDLAVHRSSRIRVVGEPGAFAGAIVLRDVDADSFDQRALTPALPALQLPPPREPAPLPPPSPPMPSKPNNRTRRLACIAVVAIVALGGFIASRISQRGIVNA